MIAMASVAAILVAVLSLWLGKRWATDEMETRFAAIERTLSRSNFPLSATVLQSLAELTQTEMMTLSESDRLLASTLAVTDKPPLTDRGGVSLGGQRYLSFLFPTVNSSMRSDRVAHVAVLFKETSLDASRRRAAVLPLITGLSTILGLSMMTYAMTSRWVQRVGRLQRSVEAVAQGNFDSLVSDDGGDEIGRLGGAVDTMARQLDQLWQQVNREQGERLLHQIASGMAHQLRNSLTGARMAIELHASDCSSSNDDGIRVAIHQLEVSEDYVRRLLMVASGRQDEEHPMPLEVCWEDVRTSLSPIARHLNIDITWRKRNETEDLELQDGPSWVAAITNLVQNSMQVAGQVQVELSVLTSTLNHSGEMVRVRVEDNGPGIDVSIASQIFEPFVTSKPEGLGLGLPVVRRAAQGLGGDVRWYREHDRTVFELDVSVRRSSGMSRPPSSTSRSGMN